MSELNPQVKDFEKFPQSAAALVRPQRVSSEDAPKAQSALGNNTKSRALFRESICLETGAVSTFELNQQRSEFAAINDKNTSVSNARNARFSAQTAASKLLFDHETPRETQWRVCGCSRRKISESVAVLHSPSIKKSHFGGLMICGSVWTCPLCAAKISERRKLEIQQATDLHKSQGGGLYMITHTFSHSRHDNLPVLMDGFGKARMYMRRQKGYKNLKLEMGYVGDIRTLEVTYGDSNGWHPHEHDLWLTEKFLTQRQLKKMKSVLFSLWLKACIYAGLSLPNREHGVNVISCQTAADYMSKFGREQKWGLASELSKQHMKVGKSGKLSPFDLLRGYENGDKRLGNLFITYAESFFGKRQIIWSDGLKKLFGIGEISDEDLAKQEVADSEILILITGLEWKKVLHQKSDVRGIILDLAERSGFDAVRFYLDSLRQ